MIRCAKLPLEVDLITLQKELKAIGPAGQWLPHFNNAYYSGDWDVLPLRSPGGLADGVIPDLIAEATYANTVLMEKFPSIQNLLSKIECPLMAVRFLNLKPGAVIKPHRDHELSFEQGEARLHIPVFTNADVEFLIDDVKLEMKEGECWYINANRIHSVANRGSTDRIHLVIDCQVTDWLRKVFDGSEKTFVEEDNSEKLKVIAELRRMGTEVGNNLADEMERELGIRHTS